MASIEKARAGSTNAKSISERRQKLVPTASRELGYPLSNPLDDDPRAITGRSQALSLPGTLSTSLPVPAHGAQGSSAVPGVPGSGSSFLVCGLSGFDFDGRHPPRCWL